VREKAHSRGKSQFQLCTCTFLWCPTQLLVVVPDAHVFALDILKQVNHCLAISIVEESSLFDGMIQSTWPKYALQMALKLVVAQRVTTKYYITLDADNIVVGPLDLTELFPGGKGVCGARAHVYYIF